MGNFTQSSVDSSASAGDDNMSFAHRLLAAAAGQWSGAEQGSILAVLKAWMKMIEDELREKQRTIVDIFALIDVHDEEIAQRVKSLDYQSLLKRVFCN